MGPQKDSDLQSYFEYANNGIEVLEDGLKEMNFGEFLVDRSVISRAQLFSALQMQDRNPGVRLGECLAALGFLGYQEIEAQLGIWNKVVTVEA